MQPRLCFLCNRETCTREPAPIPGFSIPLLGPCWVPRFLLPPSTKASINPRTMQCALIEPSKGCLHGNITQDPRRTLNRHRIFFQRRRRRLSLWRNRVSMIRPICIDYYVPLNCYCLARGCPSSFCNRFLENCIIYIYRRSYSCRQWNLSWKFLTFIVKVLLCNIERWKKCLKFHLVFKYIFSVIRGLILRWSRHWDFTTFTKFHLSMQCRKKFLKWDSAYIF